MNACLRKIYSVFSILFILCLQPGRVYSGNGPENSTPDFSVFVVVGDSIAAGLQNLSLNEGSQPNSYAAWVARQAGAALPLALISRPGVPPPLTLLDPGPPPLLGQEKGVSPGRLDPFLVPWNISVPNLKMDELLEYRPDCVPDPSVGGIRLIDVYSELILGLPACLNGEPLRSQIEMAEVLAPTFSILWVGNNDSLWAAILGKTSEISDYEVFKTSYEEVVRRMVATGAALVIGNLPDVGSTPMLTPAAALSDLIPIDPATLFVLLGIGPEDHVTLFAFDWIEAILQDPSIGPLPDEVVVTREELKAIRKAGDYFNSVVEQTAANYGIPVADIRGLLNRINKKGIVVHGRRLTTGYLGGIFSLDGFHPTNTGHAITANEFIKTINKSYKTNIRKVDVKSVMDSDPLVFTDTTHPGRWR